MTFRIELTARAERDLDGIIAYLAERSPQGAAAWAGRLYEVLEELRQNAGGASLAPESDEYSEPIRQVLFRTPRGRRYRAIFVIRDEVVLVTHIRGPGQDRVSD